MHHSRPTTRVKFMTHDDEDDDDDADAADDGGCDDATEESW